MANSLQSYVEKFLLNPSDAHNKDEDGQDIESGLLVPALTGDEAPIRSLSVSKLRKGTLEKDPKYRGTAVTRKSLMQEDHIDPDLAKMCMPENSDAEDDDLEDEDQLKNEDLSENEEDSGNEMLPDGEQEDQLDSSFGSKDEMDYSQFCDGDRGEDTDDGEDSGDGGDGEVDDSDDLSLDSNDDEESNQQIKGQQKLMSEDDGDEMKKALAVQSQLGLFDSLFSLRISMQKLVSSSKQLPQPDTYESFKQQNDSNYNNNLKTAKKNSTLLTSSLIELQNLILKNNCETKHIITGNKFKSKSSTGSDEEITSSEDEEEEEEANEPSVGVKRKLDSTECEEHLSKRFAGFALYRNSVYNKWYEKTKLLSTNKSHNKFSKLEISALQQLKNILNDHSFLIKRTQLCSLARGNTERTLGKSQTNLADVGEEYDSEIFDDSDFYTRLLEDVLKSKVSLSDNMVDVSRKWIEIQNLRKKVKRKVDTKASKGRKTRYDVMSKMQQLMAPCRHPTMDDMAINTLFRSLFGNATQNVNNT